MNSIKFTVAALLLCTIANGQSIPVDTAVHTGVLPNGFTYYIRHNEEPKNRVQLYLVNKAGSILEEDDQQGLAHFMEHMNFNGTTHFPKNELVDYLQRSGVRFGADLNAYTSFDETIYQLPLPTDDTALLENGFRIMRDWAQEATLDSVEIDKERGVVLEEARLGKGASERMRRAYWPALLNYSRYAERIPIGREELLKLFPYSAIRRYHHDWYRPDLQALIVVGDIDVPKTEALVQRLFSDLANPAPEKFRTKYEVPLTGQNRFIRVTDKEMATTEIQVLIKHKGPELKTEADYLEAMRRQLFNAMLGARLSELAQLPDPPFMQVAAGIQDFLGGLDLFAFNVSPKQGLSEQAFRAGWEALERIRRFGFTESELERAKRNYLSGMEASYTERDKQNSASYVNEYQRLFLKQEAAPGIDWEYAFVKKHLGGITLRDMSHVIKDYVKDSNRTILVLGPELQKSNLPDSVMIATWMNDVAAKHLTAYNDDASHQPLLARLPAPGKVTSEKKIPALGITELRFSNGAKVILKPTGFKNDEIRFTAFRNGGTSLYPDKDFQNAANAAIIAGMGAGAFNPVQLGKLLTGKRVSVQPYIGERSEGFEGSCSATDLSTALQLLYVRATQPRKDTGLFRNMISRSKQALEQRYNDPNNVFKDSVNYILGNYHYRRSPPTVAKLMQVDLDKTYRIYQERLGDANGLTFVFVGAFNIDSMKALLARYVGGLPSKPIVKKAKNRGMEIPAGQITKRIYKGSEDKASLRMVFSGDYSYTPENNTLLTALNEVIEMKLLEVLRETEGQVYAPSIQVSFNKYPKSRYAFTVNLGCAPANVDHLAQLVRHIIDTIQAKGPDAGTIEKFQAEFTRSHELQLRSNGYWLNYLVGQYYNDQDLLEVQDYNKRLAVITPALVQKAAQQYLGGKNVIELVLLPQSSQP